MPIVNEDPLLHQEVQVSTVESGGFLVRQMPGATNAPAPVKMIDTYCVNMDAVSALLTAIFTPPP
jgi:hypothetical protein